MSFGFVFASIEMGSGKVKYDRGFEEYAEKNPMPELPPNATSDDVYKQAGFKFYTINPDREPGGKVFLPVDDTVAKSE